MHPVPDTDDGAALVARCRQGDGSAWQALVQRYQRLVFAIVRRRGDAEQAAADVVQTMRSRLQQHLPTLTDPSRLQAWSATTTKREAWLQRRRARRGAGNWCWCCAARVTWRRCSRRTA